MFHQRDRSVVDSILIRDLLKRAQARLARLAQLPEAINNAGIYYQSFLWANGSFRCKMKPRIFSIRHKL
ncbi:hypothetical protein BYT27DRAFT_6896404 [Phlegmacium glaucopus]|nr:hypothetical protein BYT27DRAFT_6896404 [Phlegmacium glaucopus]